MNDLQHTTTGNLPSTLNRQLIEVTDQLQAASPDAVASAILKMHRAGLAYPPGIDEKRAGDIYAFACQRVAIEALKRATMAVIQGVVPNISRDFIPTPPSFAAIVRSEAAKLWNERDRIMVTLDSIKAAAPVTPSDEAKARVRARLAEFRKGVEEVRLELNPPPAPKTEAELDHLFRNKQIPSGNPQPGKMDDAEWNKQYEATHGKENFRDQDQGDGFVSGRSEGQQDGAGRGGES